MKNIVKEFKLGELFCGPGGLALGATTAKIEDSDYKIIHTRKSRRRKSVGERRKIAKSERQRNCSARTEELRRRYRMESSSLRRSRQN